MISTKTKDNIIGITVLIGVFSLPVIIPFMLMDPQSEAEFRTKYHAVETDCIIKRISYEGKGSTCYFTYETGKKTYSSISSQTSDFEQVGDAFKILYDSLDPENSLILYHRPILPEKLIPAKGIVSFISVEEKKDRVLVALKYSINNEELKRLQYFPVSYSDTLNKLFESKKEIDIYVVPDDVRRAYLMIGDVPYSK